MVKMDQHEYYRIKEGKYEKENGAANERKIHAVKRKINDKCQDYEAEN